jgi:signal transduction histidine kinase
VVADDGQGFSPSELHARPPDHGGAGLQAMRARAQVLGGEFTIQTGIGHGARVEASVPIMSA